MSASFPTIPTAVITQVFGNFNPQYYSGDGRHKGIDYGVPVGTPVYACMNGLVETAVVQNTGYGRHVVIKHGDGSRSYYGHLSSYSVVQGQPVTAGQEIGKSGGDPNDKIGGDGNSTGAHLHWEIRPAGAMSDQNAVDPNEYCLNYLPRPTGSAQVIATIGLNVRSAPNATAPILYTLKQTQVVRIAEERAGWTRLFALRPEWCASTYLVTTAAVVPNTVLSDADKLERLVKAHPELF